MKTRPGQTTKGERWTTNGRIEREFCYLFTEHLFCASALFLETRSPTHNVFVLPIILIFWRSLFFLKGILQRQEGKSPAEDSFERSCSISLYTLIDESLFLGQITNGGEKNQRLPMIGRVGSEKQSEKVKKPKKPKFRVQSFFLRSVAWKGKEREWAKGRTEENQLKWRSLAFGLFDAPSEPVSESRHISLREEEATRTWKSRTSASSSSIFTWNAISRFLPGDDEAGVKTAHTHMHAHDKSRGIPKHVDTRHIQNRRQVKRSLSSYKSIVHVRVSQQLIQNWHFPESGCEKWEVQRGHIEWESISRIEYRRRHGSRKKSQTSTRELSLTCAGKQSPARVS